MRKKMYWGIAFLILIIGVVGVYVMLQPELEFKRLLNQEAAENAKIHARKVADYEILKKKHAIMDKIASLNLQMSEIGNISADGKIRNFESSKQILELIQQQRLLYSEYDKITEESGLVQSKVTIKQFDAWNAVCSARSDYLQAQLIHQTLRNIKDSALKR